MPIPLIPAEAYETVFWTRRWRKAKHKDDLWRDFSKTAIEFEERFATEEDCRAFWIQARWGGKPACARCSSTDVWSELGGTRFECAECGHQTCLTSGTVLEKTRKPLKMWFRAMFEISSRRNGISAKELQQIMGFGSYKTAWSWLHKLRAALVRPDREHLNQGVEMDETFVGSKRPGKQMVLVAVERSGRVRLAHARRADEPTLKRSCDANVARSAGVTSDGLASYNRRTPGARDHQRSVQKN
ncbi:MAG: IS1595 family transposase [Alphaproteobacteria bacterium]|nr:IS1595 family transposase [Alphaproteobacteria bacterium]